MSSLLNEQWRRNLLGTTLTENVDAKLVKELDKKLDGIIRPAADAYLKSIRKHEEALTREYKGATLSGYDDNDKPVYGTVESVGIIEDMDAKRKGVSPISVEYWAIVFNVRTDKKVVAVSHHNISDLA